MLADDYGAKFWMGVFADIKKRGVENVLIVCVDGLAGFHDAVKAVFSDTHSHHRILHMILNSIKFVFCKEFMVDYRDLRVVYSAVNVDGDHVSLEGLG